MKLTTGMLLIFMASYSSQGQLLVDEESDPTRADTLRGTLSPARSCYDVLFYDLTVKVFPDSQSVEGTGIMIFRTLDDFETMQIDLFWNMAINSVTLNEVPVKYRREYNAVFVDAGQTVKKRSVNMLKVAYSGKPAGAKLPPWDGGLVWSKDPHGNPWIGVACEGTGASLWWPNKDHLSDEPDSVKIHIIVPDTLVAVSNGTLMGTQDIPGGWKQYDWRVTYPINNYNVTLNIGKYAHFSDTYSRDDGSRLALDYYVLPDNIDKAKKQFEQVKPMMKCFERYFGNFPFPRDGYKLVEAPYLGMEHQSAIAYGNDYQTGYAGMDYSRIGLDFDYIIIHETGHEWWGNAVSCKDIADLWIHEGFCTYAEALYAECIHGYDTALAYVNAKKPHVGNAEPVIGTYNINREGSKDMYNKGMLMLNTLRHVIDNDSLWFRIIRGILDDFSYKTTTSAEIEGYISRKSGMDLKYFFDQYLRHAAIPVFEYEIKKGVLRYRWVTDVAGFKMPLKIMLSPGSYNWIHPTTAWQEMETALRRKESLPVADHLFYVNILKR